MGDGGSPMGRAERGTFRGLAQMATIVKGLGRYGPGLGFPISHFGKQESAISLIIPIPRTHLDG